MNEFDKQLLSEYLKEGSINQVFAKHRYSLPISFAGYDRLLDKYGVVKSAGVHSRLSESLRILTLMADYKIPLERIYHSFAPKSLLVSTNTLHRMLHYVKLGLTRRLGVALLITNGDTTSDVLVANDISAFDSKLGNKGDLTIPMGYSKTGEDPIVSVKRVLQREVFVNETIDGRFPHEVIPSRLKPLMVIDIADISVAVYKLTINKRYSFSSYKLNNFRFESLEEILKLDCRAGVKDIVTAYNRSLSHQSVPFEQNVCSLNLSLVTLSKEKAPLEVE